MYLYLGPWVNDPNETKRLGVVVWAPPVGCHSGVDLRYPGNDLKNAGLFTSRTKLENKDLVYLGKGDWRRIRLNKRLKDAFFSFTGVRITRNTLAQAIYEYFTDRADVVGSSGPLPLIPSKDGKVKVSHGDERFSEEVNIRQSKRTVNKLFRLHRKDVRKLWEEGKYDDARQYVSLLLNKYGLQKSQWRLLVPRQIQDDFRGPIPPSTLYQDDFNSNSLNANWSIIQGGLTATGTRVAPDTGQAASGYNAAYWNQALHVDDHYSQIEIYQVNAGTYGGPIARQSSSGGLNCYYAEKLVGGGNKLFKWISGSATLLQDVSGTFTDGAVVKVNCNGSTIEHYYNGSLLGSVTDTSITGNLYAGFMLYLSYDSKGSDYMEGDNWEARDPIFDVSSTIASTISVSPSANLVTNDQSNIGADLSLTAEMSGGGGAEATIPIDMGVSGSSTIEISANMNLNISVGDSYEANLSTNDESSIGIPMSVSGEMPDPNVIEAIININASVSGSANLDLNAQADVDVNVDITPVGGIVHDVSETIIIDPSIKARLSKIIDLSSTLDVPVTTGPIGYSYQDELTESLNLSISGAIGQSFTDEAKLEITPQINGSVDGSTLVIESTIDFGLAICPRQFHLGEYTPQSSFSLGDNYPFIHPDEELKNVFVDIWLYIPPNKNVSPPLKLEYVYGFGPQPGSIGRDLAGSCLELGIVDGNGQVVFDTRSSIMQLYNSWGPRLSIVSWEDSQQGLLVVVFRTSWDKTEGYPSLPIYYEPQNGVLDPRTYYLQPTHVTSLAVEGQYITPTFQIEPGYNYQFDIEKEQGIRPKTTITLHTSPGEGQGKYPVDCDQQTDRTINTINDTPPDEQGNFIIKADPCFNLIANDELRYIGPVDELRINSGELELHMDCDPCSECQDYINVWEAERNIRNQIDALNQQQIAIRDTYERIIKRIEDNRKCRQEKSLFGQIIPICPDRAVILAGYCNMTDRCLRNLVVVTSLKYEDGTGKCPQLKVDNEFDLQDVNTTCGPMIQSVTEEADPGSPSSISNPSGKKPVVGQIRPLPIKYVDGRREEIEATSWVIWPSVDIGKSAYFAYGVQFDPENMPRKVEMVVEAFELGDYEPTSNDPFPVPGYKIGEGPVNTPDNMKLTECGVKVGAAIPERCCEEETDISNTPIEPLFE